MMGSTKHLLLLLALAWASAASSAESGAATAADPARDPEALQLAAVHALLAPLEGDEVLLARRADVSVPIASVTKLMTALVVLDSGADLDAWLDIRAWDPKPPNNGFSRMRIGSELRRRDLLRIMLQASENLAAHTLARHHPGGRDAFVAAMNAKAEALGMTASAFTGPSGLSPGNRASARDLLVLARAAHGEALVREYSTGGLFEARFRAPRYALTYGNTNRIVGSSRWNVHTQKTGYLSEAGRCLVMVVDLLDAPHVVVLLDAFGSRSTYGDTGRIRRWLETGETGRVAAAAAAHVRSRVARLESNGQGDGAGPSEQRSGL